VLERVSNPQELPEENEFDRALRPKKLEDFVGQDKIKEILDISIQATKLRKEPLDHRDLRQYCILNQNQDQEYSCYHRHQLVPETSS